jgi:NAD(P)H-nitrite reductase large subunit
MTRQLDHEAGSMLVREVEKLGVKVTLNMSVSEITGNNGIVEGMKFVKTHFEWKTDLIVFAVGIRPRDELAKGVVDCHPRGGILVDDKLCTNVPDIYAIGEVAIHRGQMFGLVAPGYEMAETLAKNLTGTKSIFQGADVSTKLKLLGVNVASFGDYFAGEDIAQPLIYLDPFGMII